jgi:GTP-binding protein
MNIKSAEFVKGVVGEDDIIHDGKSQVIFIGRSNVGKSSVLNSLVNQKGLAKSSSVAGKTKEANFFLIDKKLYFVDLPGYGYAKASKEDRERLRQLILWFLFDTEIENKKVVLIIDAKVGPTNLDLDMLKALQDHKVETIILANKIDKIRPSQLPKQLKEARRIVGQENIYPYSAEKKIGRNEVLQRILKS